MVDPILRNEREGWGARRFGYRFDIEEDGFRFKVEARGFLALAGPGHGLRR
jgi:hypothetical protein